MPTHNVFDKPNVKDQREFISNILENEPPYKINEFDVNWYLKFKDITDLAINCFCENCHEERVFTGVVSGEIHNAFSNDALQQAVFKGMTPADPQAFYKDRQYFLNLRLTCALCGEIHYYSLVFKGNTIIKIGQFPSFARKSEQEFIKYKNVIVRVHVVHHVVQEIHHRVVHHIHYVVQEIHQVVQNLHHLSELHNRWRCYLPLNFSAQSS